MAKLSEKNINLIANHLIDLYKEAEKDGDKRFTLYFDEAADYIEGKKADVKTSAQDICYAVTDSDEYSCSFEIDSDNVGCFTISQPFYEVYAMFYNADDEIMDGEIVIAKNGVTEFEDPKDAIALAQQFDTADQVVADYESPIDEDVDYLQIEVEKVVCRGNDYTECIDIIYEETLEFERR